MNTFEIVKNFQEVEYKTRHLVEYFFWDEHRNTIWHVCPSNRDATVSVKYSGQKAVYNKEYSCLYCPTCGLTYTDSSFISLAIKLGVIDEVQKLSTREEDRPDEWL